MTPISLPPKIEQLLASHALMGSTTALANAVGTLLDQGSMPFFPAFTDHSREHVERVLDAAEKLVPEEVWESDDLFRPADAAVLACATMLHDVAMYVQEPGFLELVSVGTPFRPCGWFDQDQEGRDRDLPWFELWRSFQRESRQLGTSQLELIFGPDDARVPKVASQEDLDPASWEKNDYLLIGEFLRRHHARLSHEIALTGFPGAGDRFPVLADLCGDLGGAIGLVARSHNESLRTMMTYLAQLDGGNKRPAGALLAYHMSVLRIADYLQIGAERAPSLLLRLKAPLSPLSVEEWDKNQAVSSVSWEHEDRRAIHFTVTARHGLRTHLALVELLGDLQRELDTSNGVLSEVFGRGELEKLTLTRNRVTSNLDQPGLQSQLSYVPRRAVLKSDPDLFRLVVRDLYGHQPAVAGRELVQNAVDAVRARQDLERRAGEVADGERDEDVLVRLEEGEEQCVLRVIDRGIGMTPEQVIDYFLQAGASFGPTPDEVDELDREEALAAIRAGRFGIGAFAGFLLGSEIEVTTRHLAAQRGVSFTARIDADLIQLDWTEAPVGTEIAIRFDPKILPGPPWAPEEQVAPRRFLEAIAQYYRLRHPSIRLVHRADGREVLISAPSDVPSPEQEPPEPWRIAAAEAYDAVYWKVYLGGPRLIHNGIEIIDPTRPNSSTDVYDWSDEGLQRLLHKPTLAVFDSRHRLGIALNRYALLDRRLPFETELLEAIGADMVAGARAHGPQAHPVLIPQNCSAVFSKEGWVPLLPDLLHRYLDRPLLVLWREARDVERPSPSPEEGAFLAPDSPVSWDDFPYRLVVGEAGLRHSEVSIWAADRGRQIGGRELASWFSSPPRPRLEPASDDFLRNVIGHISGPRRNRATDKRLSAAAKALGGERGTRMALTLFEDFDHNPKQEPLAAAWKEEIGGWMPRS